MLSFLVLMYFGNPFGLIRGVAKGVKSFFYEPYKGAKEGPRKFVEGLASGAEHLVVSTVSGAATAGSSITVHLEKLATLTFDEDYQSARIQRRQMATQTTADVVQSGKYFAKDVVYGMQGVVKKPVTGAKEEGAQGFMKGLGTGCLGLVARPASGVADFTSASFNTIKRTTTHERIVKRVRYPRHIGRDGIIRPSIADATTGLFIFNGLDMEKYTESDEYIAHIPCSDIRSGWLLATSKHLIFVTENPSIPDVYGVQWHIHYKKLKGPPVVKINPDQIEIILKERNVFGRIIRDQTDNKTVVYSKLGEARYIVDKITDRMHALEL